MRAIDLAHTRHLQRTLVQQGTEALNPRSTEAGSSPGGFRSFRTEERARQR